jgi:predicted nucleic acid-binding protein
MRIVIDTNRVIAALLKSSVSREIILSDKFDFFSPDIILSEIRKHRKYLIDKSNLDPEGFEVILFTLLERISLVPFEDFKHEFLNAVCIMNDIDVTDSAFIAAALGLKAEGIWTEDKDFSKQNVVKVFSTQALIELLEN